MSYPSKKKLKVKKEHHSNINLFIRSLLFSIYSVVSMVLYAPIVVLVGLFFPVSVIFKFIRAYLIVYLNVLKHLCHIDYRVHGLEHIKKVKAGIVLSKHQSTWETFFLPLVFKDPAIILKRELLWIPFFGWGLAAAKPIAINRKNRSSAMQQIINQGKKCLAAGRWIIMYPEGTRIPYGKVGTYRLGGARLAVATGYPVVPVAHNTGKFWPRRSFVKQPGTIHIVIGPAIQSKGRTPEEVLELSKSWIESTVLKIDRFVDEPAS